MTFNSLTCGGDKKALINFTEVKVASRAPHGLTRTWCLWRMATRSSIPQRRTRAVVKSGCDFVKFKADLEEEFKTDVEHSQRLALVLKMGSVKV